MGVQDFTAEVQEAIEPRPDLRGDPGPVGARARDRLRRGRQLRPRLRPAAGRARRPSRASLERVLELRPDRLAVYSFAYVPWIKATSARSTRTACRAPDVKLELYLDGAAAPSRAPATSRSAWTTSPCRTDELAVASREGRLARNFMGYTVKPATAAGLRHHRDRRPRRRATSRTTRSLRPTTGHRRGRAAGREGRACSTTTTGCGVGSSPS